MSVLRCAGKVSLPHLVRYLESGTKTAPWDPLLEALILVAQSPFPEIATPVFDFWVALNEASRQSPRATQLPLGSFPYLFHSKLKTHRVSISSISSDD